MEKNNFVKQRYYNSISESQLTSTYLMICIYVYVHVCVHVCVYIYIYIYIILLKKATAETTWEIIVLTSLIIVLPSIHVLHYTYIESASWTDGLIVQLVRASERNSLVLGSNPTRVNFL